MHQVEFWSPQLAMEQRADGSMLVWRQDPLGVYPDKLTERLIHWAEITPDRVWLAQRDDNGAWRTVTYADAAAKIHSLAQAMIDCELSELSAQRPLMILSGNDIEHALIAFAAQYIGVPSVAVSTAYSLISNDHQKLRDIAEQLTPGLLFATDAELFKTAIAKLPADIPLVSVRHRLNDRQHWLFSDWLTTRATAMVAAAHAAVGPDTIAKFLLTSGTTGSPKAVIQTQRMLCSNQAMIADCYAFVRDEPPVVVDWAPWSHTASGNKVFNFVLYNGGTYYIDEGKPAAATIDATLRNLRDIAPTWYFNVPAGFELLINAMEEDSALRENFFSRLKLLMYAGAGMAQHTWQRLTSMAEETVGHSVLLTTGLGSTETAPFTLFCTEAQSEPGNVGIPAQGVTLKLVPHDDKLEARLKGPNITPGYWREPELSKQAFDEEGYYKLGDALRFAVPGDPAKGFFFDGRLAENFKLNTGTWVSVGAVRAQLVNQMGGLLRDAVISGEDRNELGALLIPFMPKLRALVPEQSSLDDRTILSHPQVRAELQRRLQDHAQQATGSATRVNRVMLLEDEPSLDRGELTDKGSINQRAVLRNRQKLVDALYQDDGRVISVSD